ncbi:MAG: pseudouridine synthase [Neisseria sp.]|nr:pseudouridine synthase [Neisseria sp.]
MTLIALNKPYGVICQFSAHDKHPSLKDYVALPDVYPAGRLDTDSEGLLLLTDDGRLQAKITQPRYRLRKTYWAQVEGVPDDAALENLRRGVDLGDFVTRPAIVKRLPEPHNLWPRTPPIRVRKTVPDSWLEIVIDEGKNRQVRRMCARVGYPCLRLVRVGIGRIDLLAMDLQPGQWQYVQGMP